jgi:hypothetical protein
MRSHRLLAAATVLVLAALAMPVRAAPSTVSGVAPALMRFMLASAKYTDMAVEIDGRQALRQPANTASAYIAISADQPHTLAVYGVSLGDPVPALVRKIADYRLAQGSYHTSIFADDGTLHHPEPVPPVPAGKSILNPVLAGPVSLAFGPSFRFGSLPLRFVGGIAGAPVYEVISPKTERLELRTFNGNKLVRTEYLRAQPGYRYDLIVVPRLKDGKEEYELVVVPTSPQLAARPTATRTYQETGHILEGRFQQYWDGTGGLPVYGFPLNDDRLERTPEGAYVTQVFERNRFEYHPENKAPYDVLLGRLGDERLRQLGRDWRKEFTARPAGADCSTVDVDGRQFAVCEPFRTYYRTHGLELDGQPGFSPAESLALFGLPLTQANMEINSSGDRVLTQWFERARFELHPNNPAPYRVLLGRLGYEVYNLEPLTFDDEDRAFKRRSALGAPDWNEAAGGFGGHYWWTCAENIAGEIGNLTAEWSGLPGTSERYALEIFVPGQHSNSRNVPITYIWGHDAVGSRLDQRPYGNAWVRLPHSSVDRLLVSSATGEGGNCAAQLAVDAIRFVPKAAAR